jgi:2-desacetyl-2-hydroxyethyl bacteriochlorophyllide A dehydrogenase
VTRARAFWVTGPGACELRETTVGEPRMDEVLVQTLYSAVSRGTEALVYNGRVPVSEYTRMRCPHQEGDFPAPVKYGYSSVGRVIRGQSELQGCVVFCLYPHQSAFVVPAVAVVPVPDGVPPERAVLGANLETALTALWDAAPRFGDRISVVGAGVVGCLCAYLAARIPGTDVELIDVRPERADVAHALGARFATPEGARRHRDLVLHASGTGAGLRTALELATLDASIVEISWFGDEQVALPLGQAFHVKRLSLRSSQVGTVSPMARRRFTHASRLELALSLCADPALDALFSGESALEALPVVMAELASNASGALCQRIRYS